MNQEAQYLRPAVAYLRVARDDQSEAIARQRDACERIAVKYDCAIVREYVDAGCPARLEQQVELRRLLRELTTPSSVTAVVVYDLARLADDLDQLERILAHLRVCGIEVLTETGVEVAERFVQSQRMREAFRRPGTPEVREGGAE